MDVEIHPNAKKHLTENRCLVPGSRFLSVFAASRKTSRRDGLPLDGFQTVEVWNLLRSNLFVDGSLFMPCLRFRRNSGKRSSELGKGVDDGQDIYDRQWSGCYG